MISRLRKKVALWICPDLYVPYAYDREEAFKDLAEAAWGDRETVWTSPRALVAAALKKAASDG